jgi:hypothetical protein
MELYRMQFPTFERNIRSLLGRILMPGGFDPAQDIQAITVSRWPHGYAYEYNSLFDPNWPENERPCVIGRQPFGRISIANSDAPFTTPAPRSIRPTAQLRSNCFSQRAPASDLALFFTRSFGYRFGRHPAGAICGRLRTHIKQCLQN